MEEKIKDELEIACIRKNCLKRLFDEANEKACLVLMLTIQWKELDAHFDETQKSLEKQADEASLRERRLEETRVLLEKRAAEIEKKEKEFGHFRTLVEELREEHESRENALTEIRGSIEQKNQELNRCKTELDECCKQLHSKREELLVVKKTVKEELSSKKEQLGLAKTELTEYCNKVHLEKEELRKSMEEKERQFGVLTRAHKGLRIEISEKDAELVSTTAKLEKHLLELLFKKEELNTTEKSVKECREELQLWEAKLCSVKKTLEERLLELESKGKEFTKVSNDLECKEKELIKLEFFIKESVAEHELITKQSKQKQNDQNNSLGERRLNLVLAEHLAQKDLLSDEVTAKLYGSTDPAKWVLEQLHSNSWKGYNDSTIMRRACILLLEQLMMILPIINAQVKDDAMTLAIEWKANLPKKSVEVLCFLMLLAAFKLFYAFNKDELLYFVNALGQERQVPELRKRIENAHNSPRSDKPALVKHAKEEKVEDLTEVGREVVSLDNLQSGSNKRIRIL